MAGGNGILSVLGSPGLAMEAGHGPTQPVVSMPSSRVANTSGGEASLGRVQIATAALLVVSLAVLVALNKAGFRFSVTVG